MRNKLLFILTSLFIFSCTSQQEKEMQQRKLIKAKRIQEKKEISKTLTAKYNIAYRWDTLNYDYSVEFDSVLASKNQLIQDVRINDIYHKDSIDYVSIITGSNPAFYFDFPVSKEQKKKLLGDDRDLILVISITEIRRTRFSLSGENDGEETSVYLDNSNEFIGRGYIVDILQAKKYKAGIE